MNTLTPIPLADIRLEGFLGRRVDRNVASLIAGLQSPIPDAFHAYARGERPAERGGSRLTDLFKWTEAASYAVEYDPASGVRTHLTLIADLIAEADPAIRRDATVWQNLYVAGHFFQAAVAHERATGHTDLLDKACDWAHALENLDENEGIATASPQGATYHPCIELGLIQLARRTGDLTYRDFARSLIHRHGISDTVAGLEISANDRHAVCVTYLLTALAELARDTSDDESLERVSRLWEDLVTVKSHSQLKLIGLRGIHALCRAS